MFKKYDQNALSRKYMLHKNKDVFGTGTIANMAKFSLKIIKSSGKKNLKKI